MRHTDNRTSLTAQMPSANLDNELRYMYMCDANFSVEYWMNLMRFWMDIDERLQCNETRDALDFATD